MIFPVNRDRSKAPEKRPLNLSWVGAVSAIAALVAVVLWLRGYLYRSAFFETLGLSVDQFPMSYPEIVTIGVTSSVEGLVRGLLPLFVLLVLLTMIVVAWPPESRWFFGKRAAGHVKRGADHAPVVPLFLIVFFSATATLLGFLIFLIWSFGAGSNAARAALAELTANECPIARASSPKNHILIERTVLGADGKEKIQHEEGTRVMCSEKFCAYLVLTRDKKAWQSKIAALEKITRFESCEILLAPPPVDQRLLLP